MQVTTQQNGNVTSSPFNFTYLHEQVRNVLAEQIAAGKWKGDRGQLPNETALAMQMGVSAGTMRKALDQLEREGLVVRKQGRGTFVVDQEDKAASDEKRRHACIAKALQIIRTAMEETASKNIPQKFQTALQTHITDSLMKAGYSGEAT